MLEKRMQIDALNAEYRRKVDALTAENARLTSALTAEISEMNEELKSLVHPDARNSMNVTGKKRQRSTSED